MLKSKIFQMRRVFFWGMFLAMGVCFGGWVAEAQAAIQFDENGKWETSFDMEDWTHTTTPTVLYNGMVAPNDNCAGPCSFPCAKTTQCAPEQVLASANNPNGIPNTAAQVHYFYTGIDGQGSANNISSGLRIDFPSPLKEFWFRVYVYYPEEMTNKGWKIFRFYGEDENPWMAQPYDHSYAGMYFMGGGSGVVRSADHHASWMDDNNRQGYGAWTPIEVYIRNNDTGQSNGIFRVWRGADLIINRTYLNTSTPHTIGIQVGSNGDGISGPANTVVGIRFDDIVIYNQTPPNSDIHGNPFIGPIDWGESSAIPGDINKDGVVNIFDYNIFLQHFGVVEDCQNSADLNGDCAVNIFDYNILLQNFGRTE
jgi:hypothetical protein